LTDREVRRIAEIFQRGVRIGYDYRIVESYRDTMEKLKEH